MSFNEVTAALLLNGGPGVETFASLALASGDQSNGIIQKPHMKRWTFTVGLS